MVLPMPKAPPQDFDRRILAALGRIESRLAVVEAKLDGLIDVQNQVDAEQAAREDAEMPPGVERIDVPPDLARFLPPRPRR